MKFHALTPLTLQDFPDQLACIVWCAGCNLRCGYCHNAEVVRDCDGELSTAQVLYFLHQRRHMLDAIVVSGGEPTLQANLPVFLKAAKRWGYKTQLDTNGTQPQMVEKLLSAGLLDRIALDYKAPSYAFTRLTEKPLFEAFVTTLRLLCEQDRVPFVVRTTLHPDLLDAPDIDAITQHLHQLGYKGEYVLQHYVEPPAGTLKKLPRPSRPMDLSELNPCPPGIDRQERYDQLYSAA